MQDSLTSLLNTDFNNRLFKLYWFKLPSQTNNRESVLSCDGARLLGEGFEAQINFIVNLFSCRNWHSQILTRIVLLCCNYVIPILLGLFCSWLWLAVLHCFNRVSILNFSIVFLFPWWRNWHTTTFLKTQTFSQQAIYLSIYLKFFLRLKST